MAVGVITRPGRDSDGPGYIELIASCWAEYPGCVMDVDGENPELRALASYFSKAGGTAWTAESDGKIVGMVGVRPGGDGSWELCRLYVAASFRGTGLAARLLDEAQRWVAAHGACGFDLWSDTRFDRAHRFYERHGFVRSGGIRSLNDKSRSLEFRYAKPLGDVTVLHLDTAASASAARSLGRVLLACVSAGASVSFLPSLSLDEATVFFGRYSSEVAAGDRIVLAAWLDGRLAGTVSLGLDTPPNQPHRAEVQKLLVHPDARRRGVARALMSAVETAAKTAGRTLLTLDTRSRDAAERLYREQGWICAGHIPGYSISTAGSFDSTSLFYKHIQQTFAN